MIKKQTAFTLAEVLMTLAILGALVAITTPIIRNALPNFNIYRVKKINTTLKDTIDDMLNNDPNYEGKHDFSNTGYMTQGNEIKHDIRTFRNVFNNKVDMKDSFECEAYGVGGKIECFVSVDNIVWAIPFTDFVSTENGSVVIDRGTKEYYENNYFVPITVYPDYKKDKAEKDPDGYMKDNAVIYGVRRDGKVIFIDDINCENNPKSMQCLAITEVGSSRMKRR